LPNGLRWVFFFGKAHQQISAVFKNIYSGGGAAGIGAGGIDAQISKRLHWKIEAIYIAETGIFNQPNKTPLESVMNADLWDVMEVVSLKVARIKTENAMQEAESKKRK